VFICMFVRCDVFVGVGGWVMKLVSICGLGVSGGGLVWVRSLGTHAPDGDTDGMCGVLAMHALL